MKAAPELDNPILRSLESEHARFALTAGRARRFIPEVGPLAGFEGPADEALSALGGLAAPSDAVSFFLDAPISPPPAWHVSIQRPLLQMTHEGGALDEPAGPFVELGEKDAAEMLALATLTKPGPFSIRTRELGGFVGVREGGRLAAMVGERLRLPGWTEVSAVCAHPEHLGRGHAGRLMKIVVRRILARGERPFLHVLPENARAVAVYERLGFAKRRLFTYASVRRGGPAL